MMFFGKPKEAEQAGSAAPKRRSTLGILFNPQIGASIKPLRETTSVFVSLIGMIFAMNGLFPKDHPGLRGVEGAHLTLSEIFGTAWNGLSFTKAGIPRVVLFFAVTGAMIFAVLSVITALLAGFVGSAHAQGTTGTSSGFFTPPDATNDLAQGWLDYIFKGIPLSNYYAQNGTAIPQSTGIQCAMISALGFYSKAMLIFAAIILFYHLVTMVVSTAHEGVAMGKRANQIWAPIRLVVAIGLLVPIGGAGNSCPSGTGAGLNAGQYIVIQMASWGSGMASQTWKVFVTALSNMGNDIIQPNVPDATKMVKDITLMEACKFAWNFQVCMTDTTNGGDVSKCANPNDYSPSDSFKNQIIATPTPTGTDKTTGNTYYRYYPENMQNNPHLCGEIDIPAAVAVPTATPAATVGATMNVTNTSTQIAVAITKAQQQTIHDMLLDGGNSGFRAVGADIAKTSINELNDGVVPTNDDYVTLVNTYQQRLAQNLNSALSSHSLSADQVAAMSSLGWASAGAWLNTIARDQGAIVNAYEDGLPRTIRPDVTQIMSNKWAPIVANQLRGFEGWLDYTPAAQMTTASQTGCQDQQLASLGAADSGGTGLGATNSPSAPNTPLPAALSRVQDTVTKLATALMGGKAPGKDIAQDLFAVIDAQAVRSGIWDDPQTNSVCGNDKKYFNLGTQLVTANPLAELSFWGYANLRAAYSLYGDIFEFSVASIRDRIKQQVQQFATASKAGEAQQYDIQGIGLESQAYGFVSSLLSMFATIFFACGFTLAFMVPLLPFFRFFFNVLTWFVSLLEAIVGVPLIALAHLNPEGDGLPGQSAKAAYFMVFNIFLRPIMTLFGLIAGLVVFYVAIMLLNATYAIAVAGTGGAYHFGIGSLVRIAYTVIYGATAYVCANNAFKPIGFFPEHAMRWIGASAYHERMGDGGRAVQAAAGQAQGYLGERALGVIKLNPPG